MKIYYIHTHIFQTTSVWPKNESNNKNQRVLLDFTVKKLLYRPGGVFKFIQ